LPDSITSLNSLASHKRAIKDHYISQCAWLWFFLFKLICSLFVFQNLLSKHVCVYICICVCVYIIYIFNYNFLLGFSFLNLLK
jgi:hypothetical protein